LYAKMKAGLWPKPISLGVNSVGWVEGENEQVLGAMIAGESTDDIKQLVSSLMKERKTIGRKMAGEA
jgi:prophage regulatory protein